MSNSDDMSDSVSLSETPQSLSSDSMRSPRASYYSGARRLSGPGGAFVHLCNCVFFPEKMEMGILEAYGLLGLQVGANPAQ